MPGSTIADDCCQASQVCTHLAGTCVVDAEQVGHQRLRAKAAVAHTDAILSAEDRATLA